jgi:hypothetical protein
MSFGADSDWGAAMDDAADTWDELEGLAGLEAPEILELPRSIHRAYSVSSADSDSEDGLDNGDLRDEDSEAENSEDEPDIFDWDSFQVPTEGLAEWDKLGEEFEAEAAIGALTVPFFLLSSVAHVFVHSSKA